MKRLSSVKLRARAGVWLVLVAAGIYTASLALAVGADGKGEAKAGKAAPAQQKTDKKAGKKKLTGAELYAMNCGRCHPERYPTEFTPAQWKTVMIEMRVRANLPAEQAKAILKYLQEDSGTP